MSGAQEQQVLQSIEAFRGEFNVFVTQLLGAPDQDKPNGRIPLLETASASHEKRITRIERVFLMFCGAAFLLKTMAWMADSVYHIAEVFHVFHY